MTGRSEGICGKSRFGERIFCLHKCKVIFYSMQAAAHPEYVERVEGTDVMIRTGAKKTDKVVLISGGGSGHEPAHGGFVGKGMLDGAVAGAVFTSPTPDQVYEAIKATECGKGALLIIKNYTGDVMNFEMAADMASDEDIEVDKVIVADDVAVENSTWTTGRRGIAGRLRKAQALQK